MLLYTIEMVVKILLLVCWKKEDLFLGDIKIKKNLFMY